MLSNRKSSVVILVVVAIVISLAAQTMAGSCVPTSTKPDIGSMEIKNVASDRGPVLANLAGYVELLGNNSSTYLPLDIDSISFWKPTDSDRTVILESDCFRFTIDLKSRIPDVNPGYVFTGLKMELKNRSEASCGFNGNDSFYFFVPQDLRYSCKQVLSHRCTREGKSIVNLVLSSFELELEGNTKSVSKGEFTKSAWPYSCNYWK